MNAIQKLLEASSDLRTLEVAVEVFQELKESLKTPQISPDDLIIMSIFASVSHILDNDHEDIIRLDTGHPISDDDYSNLLRIKNLCIQRYMSSDLDDILFKLLSDIDLSSIEIFKEENNSVSYEFNSTF